MSNSEPQITDADRAAAEGVLSALSLGSRSADDCAFMIANAMAPEREAVRKRIEAADALVEHIEDLAKASIHPMSKGVRQKIDAYRAACKPENGDVE